MKTKTTVRNLVYVSVQQKNIKDSMFYYCSEQPSEFEQSKVGGENLLPVGAEVTAMGVSNRNP